ncbi:MAG: hypothetical protein Q8Q23_03090 [bacterium]|nr:hypothetical protein [bacterium]
MKFSKKIIINIFVSFVILFIWYVMLQLGTPHGMPRCAPTTATCPDWTVLYDAAFVRCPSQCITITQLVLGYIILLAPSAVYFFTSMLQMNKIWKIVVFLGVTTVMVVVAYIVYIDNFQWRSEGWRWSEGWPPSSTVQQPPYYKSLLTNCQNQNDECCIESVTVMQKSGYIPMPSSGCPAGLMQNQLRCLGSYQWCEPIKK